VLDLGTEGAQVDIKDLALPKQKSESASLLSISGFLCEKVLSEPDHVLSAIRIVEVFGITVVPDIPLEKQGPAMVAVVIGKLADDLEHSVDLHLVRPNGEATNLTEKPFRQKFPAIIPGFPAGFNVAFQFGVIPKQMGLHYVRVLFDGIEVYRIPFILNEVKLSPMR
jgi:hypothetical protein